MAYCKYVDGMYLSLHRINRLITFALDPKIWPFPSSILSMSSGHISRDILLCQHSRKLHPAGVSHSLCDSAQTERGQWATEDFIYMQILCWCFMQWIKRYKYIQRENQVRSLERF